MFKTLKQGIKGGAVTLVSGLMVTGLAHADDASSYQDLNQRIQSIEQQLQTLEAQKSASTDSGSSTSAGFNGFSFKSADGQYTLNIHALVQFDGRFFPDAPSAQGLLDTFTLRRVEPSLQGNLTPLFSYVIMPEFGGSPTSTVTADLYGEFHFNPKYFNLKVGKFKEPVGLENLQSSANLAFVERGLPTDLVPNRDLGIQESGSIGNAQLSYAIGVFNGAPDGADANATDPDNHKEIAGRLFAQPWHDGNGGALDNLGFGISGSAGREDSLSTTYDSPGGTLGTNGLLPQYKTPGQNVFFQYGTSTTSVAAYGPHSRVSPQAYYYNGSFGALAEYVVTHQQLEVAGKQKDVGDVTNKAQELTLSYVLSGEKAGYNGIKPSTPFTSNGSGWGAFELVARAGQLTVGQDAFAKFADGTSLASATVSASQARSQGIGLNWYLTNNIKTQFDYDQTHFTDGAAVGNRPVEHSVEARAQYSF